MFLVMLLLTDVCATVRTMHCCKCVLHVAVYLCGFASCMLLKAMLWTVPFHIYYVRDCCKGAATGLCECIKYKADPLGDRHTASVPLCLDCCK